MTIVRWNPWPLSLLESRGSPARPPSECNERYAELIEADRTVIVASYVRNLEALCTARTCGPRFRDQALADATEVINNVVKSVAAGEVRLAPRTSAVRVIDQRGYESCPSPIDQIRAARILFDIALASFAGHFNEDPALLQCFTIAVSALNEGISRCIGEAAVACTGFLLSRVHEAQAQERRRIARDLHDRLGEQLSVGLRQLDLLEIVGQEDPLSQAGIPRRVLTEAMERLRRVTFDLREEPPISLEKALIGYLDSAGADAEVRMRISGDEAWAPPAVLEEVFLIIREAARNALAHAASKLVLIDVELTPQELRALVKDDGRGFVPGTGVTGTGLASMRERSASIEGRLTVSSVSGSGTSVELMVSLPGHREE